MTRVAIIKRALRRVPGLLRLYIAVLSGLQQFSRPLLNSLLSLHDVRYKMHDVISTKNCEFFTDHDFQRGYQAAMGQQYLPNFDGWIIHINQWAAAHCVFLDGDFVECGVNRGRLSMSNIIYTRFEQFKHKKYYLFDTYCGLDSAVSSTEEVKFYKSAYHECYNFVRESFQKFPNVVIVKGSIPDTLTSVSITSVAFLHIDMNSVAPEIAALQYFWPLVVKGGIIILDDYAQPVHEKQKQAFDSFATHESIKILSLPTGQGMIVK